MKNNERDHWQQQVALDQFHEMQVIYLGYMYSRWRKIRGLDKNAQMENTGQMQSSFKEFEKINSKN